DSQICDKVKIGVGFDSQVFHNQVNHKYKTGEGYHAVPPPYTWNFMPRKSNLILADVDEYVISDTVTSVPAVATNAAKTRVVDNGCSRHMTGIRSYLSEYEEINGGYVAFGGDPKGGKITGKGKISRDTECIVLSHDFKLLNESKVLLRVPRKNNMYNVNLKNVAPSG
nr:hypothetical protein [Tanacetum cinerariifolium]